MRKCPYCDFNSWARPHDVELPEREYVDALLRDLERELPGIWGRRVESVFLGGGTPSLFSPEAIDHLLSGIRARLPLLAHAEISMEANPGTFEQARFAEFHTAGVNRLSIGMQSFNSGMLERLGRIHDGSEAYRAFEIARKAGFANINLDLMFGLPGQDRNNALDDLKTARQLGPEHISWYQLTLEPDTRFHADPPHLPDDDTLWEMQCSGQDMLAGEGYTQYEVSAYSKTGRQCQHNRNYWEFGDYLGIGAGAHGKVTGLAGKQITRHAKPGHPRQYLASLAKDVPLATRRIVQPSELPFEFMLNALRLTDGFPASLFQERTGLAWQMVEADIQHLLQDELLEAVDETIRPTALGRRFLNELITGFLSDEIPATHKNR